MNARSWTFVAERLVYSGPLFALDIRGNGESHPDPKGTYEPSRLIEDLGEVIVQLDLGRCVLIGHSFGGAVALEYASRHLNELAAMVFVDYAPELALPALEYMRRLVREQPVEFASRRAYSDWVQKIYPLVSAEVREILIHDGADVSAGVYRPRIDPRFRGALLAGYDRVFTNPIGISARWRAIQRFALPTMIVRGASSAFVTREVAVRMAASMRAHARVEEVPRAGHAVMVDNPASFAAILDRFLECGVS